jgi:hypothetical protein
MVGIVGQEILALRGELTGGQLTINTDHAGLYLNSVCMFASRYTIPLPRPLAIASMLLRS